MIDHLTLNQEVVGSNPTRPTIFSKVKRHFVTIPSKTETDKTGKNPAKSTRKSDKKVTKSMGQEALSVDVDEVAWSP